jgi:hypothetical protein
MKRKTVIEQGPEIDLYGLLDFETFDGAIAQLEREKEMYLLRYADAISIKFSVISAGYDGGVECRLVIERWETDIEFEKRKFKADKAKRAAAGRAQKAKQKAQKLLLATEAQEKALLKELQAKYGEVK